MNNKAKRATDDDDYRLRTVHEAADMLKCSVSKIYRLKAEGRLEFVKLDNMSRVTERSIQRLLSEMFSGVDKGERDADRSD